jgi:hypothetical protein
MQILTVKELYNKYPDKKFYQIFYTDKQIVNFKSGFNENKNGINFTGILNETIMFPYGLFSKFPCGEFFPKWICEVYFINEASDAEIYIYDTNKYCTYKKENDIDFEKFNNQEMD